MARRNQLPRALAGRCPWHSLFWGCDPLVRLTALDGSGWRRMHPQLRQHVLASPKLSQGQTRLALRVKGCGLPRHCPQPAVQAQGSVKHFAGDCYYPLVDAHSHRVARLCSFVWVNAVPNDKCVMYMQAYPPLVFPAYDAPGCGESSCEDLSKVSISFLVETAKAVLHELRIEQYHLIGHSMGGLTALMLAYEMPERVLSFVDIEGNVAPEDCFLSRQVLTHPSNNAQVFLDGFVDRTRHMPFYSSALYAANVRHKVHPDIVRGIFESMVQLSDHSDLMSIFLAMPFPLMFMYGEQNSLLSYLPKLKANNVELAEIPCSGHWPMYSNPVAMWQCIVKFLPS